LVLSILVLVLMVYTYRIFGELQSLKHQIKLNQKINSEDGKSSIKPPTQVVSVESVPSVDTTKKPPTQTIKF
jgi:cell division protein FtsL